MDRTTLLVSKIKAFEPLIKARQQKAAKRLADRAQQPHPFSPPQVSGSTDLEVSRIVQQEEVGLSMLRNITNA